MLRVGDCAYEAHTNRIGIADLRLLGYPVAVHADMLFWAPEESLRLCSRQLLNILFAVPQISVILADSTEEQKALIQAYLTYWTENRELLLHGKFCPLFPEQNFTRITVESEDRVIAVLHADLPYTYDGRSCDVFHNGQSDGLVFENPTDETLEAEIYLSFGAETLCTAMIPPHSLIRLPVPPTGMVRVR
jgi:alpha-galactosidase